MTGRIDLGSVVLGRYRLDEQVAAGGMGVLWRATDEVLDETVALKRVSFAHLGAEHADVTRERTLREARLAAKLRGHPNVVSLYDVQVDDGDVWLVLEYVPSRSLGQLLTANGPLDPVEAARIGAAVAHALTAAHALGIQHRDVTPGNVLIGENGTVKLTDFGIAHSAGDERITQTNAVVGTIAYLAPEVARGDDATSASDVFSLGSTLYTTVEGQPPFGRHDNPVRMLNIVGSGIIRPPENAGPLTPLLLRMLELNPATRPDAGTLHEQLRQIAARSSMTDNGPDKDTTGPPVPARSRRLAPLAGVLVAVALLAVVLAIVLADGNQVPGSPRAASAPEIRMGDDQRSIDSCALLKVKDGSLRQFDDLQQPVPGIDLGSCRADITGKYDTALVSVEISGPTNGSSDLDGRKVDLGGVAVFQQPLQNNSDGKKCQSVVRLSDNSDFYFYTYPTSFTLGKPIDLCAVTRTVAAAAVHRFASTGIPRSAGLYANYPIAARDACDTVDDATLRSAAGADPQQHYHGFANWSCHWGTEEPGRSSVSVTFQLRGKDDLDGEGASTKVAGHLAYQKQGQPKKKNNPWECQLHIVQTPPEHGSTLSQAFTVVVNSPQPQRRQCAAANTVATAVEQNLWP